MNRDNIYDNSEFTDTNDEDDEHDKHKINHHNLTAGHIENIVAEGPLHNIFNAIQTAIQDIDLAELVGIKTPVINTTINNNGSSNNSGSKVNQDGSIDIENGVDGNIQKQQTTINYRRVNEIVFLLGGASLVSYAFRTLIFGKTIRAIEIPDGNISTFIIRRNSLSSLKQMILKHSDPIYPGVTLTPDDIKASAYYQPNFTEPIITNKDVKLLPDYSYIVWTKADFEIPRTFVELKSLVKERELFMKQSLNSEIDKIINWISLITDEKYQQMQSLTNLATTSIFRTKLSTDFEILRDDPFNLLTNQEKDELILLLIMKDGQQIIEIYRKNSQNILTFKRDIKKWIVNKISKQKQ